MTTRTPRWSSAVSAAIGRGGRAQQRGLGDLDDQGAASTPWSSSASRTPSTKSGLLDLARRHVDADVHARAPSTLPRPRPRPGGRPRAGPSARSGRIEPCSSAISMNWPGGDEAALRVAPADERLDPAIAPVCEVRRSAGSAARAGRGRRPAGARSPARGDRGSRSACRVEDREAGLAAGLRPRTSRRRRCARGRRRCRHRRGRPRCRCYAEMETVAGRARTAPGARGPGGRP